MDTSYQTLANAIIRTLVYGNDDLIHYLVTHLVRNVYDLDFVLGAYCESLELSSGHDEIVERVLGIGLTCFTDVEPSPELVEQVLNHQKVRNISNLLDLAQLRIALLVDAELFRMLWLAVNTPAPVAHRSLGAYIVVRTSGDAVEAAACSTFADAEATRDAWIKQDMARLLPDIHPSTPLSACTAALAQLNIRFTLTNSIRSVLK